MVGTDLADAPAVLDDELPVDGDTAEDRMTASGATSDQSGSHGRLGPQPGDDERARDGR